MQTTARGSPIARQQAPRTSPVAPITIILARTRRPRRGATRNVGVAVPNLNSWVTVKIPKVIAITVTPPIAVMV